MAKMNGKKKGLASFDCLIVGAGAAGVGMGVCLRDLGMKKFAILERHEIGASFNRWSKGMRFITPSFTSNSFGFPDLNAVTFNTSPAYTLRTEHPTGKEYAAYLKAVARRFELPVAEGVEVKRVKKLTSGFAVETRSETLHTRFLIWAAGEFQYPRDDCFEGAELCLHNSRVPDWSELEGDERVVIGGYESGIDAAVHLAKAGVRVRVIERGNSWESRESDPSVALSPFTLDRLRKAQRTKRIELIAGAEVSHVEHRDANGARSESGFLIHGIQDEKPVIWATAHQPILATGFKGGAHLIRDLFAWRAEDAQPELSEFDESTIAPGLFLTGPQVRQEQIIFCFIYKFRQRFAVIANQIAVRLRIDASPLEIYRQRGMYLDDLSCCTSNCEC